MKIAVLVFAVLVACCIPVSEVSAHVLVMDETKAHGAVLHIIPDDDPIAGQPSSLYFDMQDELTKSDAIVRLSITDSKGENMTIKTQRNGSLVTATYTFPAQGVYELTYTVAIGEKEYTFHQAQRVSRGVTTGALETSSHTWAQGLFVGSLFGLAAVIIIGFNRRKEIARQSTF